MQSGLVSERLADVQDSHNNRQIHAHARFLSSAETGIYARFSGADNSESPFSRLSRTPLARSPPNPSRHTPSFSRRKSRLPAVAELLRSDGFEPVAGRDQCPAQTANVPNGAFASSRTSTPPRAFLPRRSKRSIRYFAKSPPRGSLEFRTLSGPALGKSCAADRSMNPGTVLIMLLCGRVGQTKNRASTNLSSAFFSFRFGSLEV